MAGVPFDQDDGKIWFNGAFVDWGEAKIHVLTHGLHYASCVFEGERAYGGEIFKLSEHTERLLEIAPSFSTSPSPTRSTRSTRSAASCLVAEQPRRRLCPPGRLARQRDDGRLGAEQPDQRRDRGLGLAVLFQPGAAAEGHPPRHGRSGAGPIRAPRPAKSKAAGLYMICTLSKHAAERKGYADALMLDWRGQVAEATGANVFFVKDGKIHTPTPDCFLDGITRRTVIELAKRARLRGDRAGDHAGGDGGLRAVLPDRHRRRGDAGLRDRPLPLHGRRDHQDADGRLLRLRAAGEGKAGRCAAERVNAHPYSLASPRTAEGRAGADPQRGAGIWTPARRFAASGATPGSNHVAGRFERDHRDFRRHHEAERQAGQAKA